MGHHYPRRRSWVNYKSVTNTNEPNLRLALKEVLEGDLWNRPQRSANSEFTFDPTNKVVGSIDAAVDAKDAMRNLTAAGFAASEVELLTDQEGAARIDNSGGGTKRWSISFINFYGRFAAEGLEP